MQSTSSKRARPVFLETLLPRVAWSARDATWGGAAEALAVANRGHEEPADTLLPLPPLDGLFREAEVQVPLCRD